MNVFEIIIINLIFIILPLTLWLLYQTYSKTLHIKKSKLFLDIALISSMYLILKFGIDSILLMPILSFNIPLIIAYIKDRKLAIILLSITSIGYYFYYLDFNIYILIIEYVFYYLVYLVIRIKKLKNDLMVNIFIVVKLIIFITKIAVDPNFIIKTGYQLKEIIVLLIAFYLVTKFVIYLFKTAEDILQIHLKFCELQYQKEATDSLFQITHEIKNPIAVCKGYLDMFDVNNVEHSKKYVPILKEEMNRLLILLQDFLSINHIKINKEIMDINLLLEDLLKSFMPIFKGKNIKANFSIDEDEFYILGDYNRLRQVFMNLIKNSMEAIPSRSNGMISVYLKKVPGHIKIYVEDNGEGINKEIMKKIKSPFFTTKSQGTGLGVYLCSKIIEAHGGEIKYFSKEKKGTKVIVTLPYNKKDIKNFS